MGVLGSSKMLRCGSSCRFLCLAGHWGHRVLTTQPDWEPSSLRFCLTLVPSGRVTLGCLPHVPHLPQAVWPLAHPFPSHSLPELLSRYRAPLPFRAQLILWCGSLYPAPNSQGLHQRTPEKSTFLHLVFGDVFCSIFSLNSLGEQGGGKICC